MPQKDSKKTSASPGKRKKRRLILPLILIIGGLLMLASPWIGRLYNQWQERALLASFADEDEADAAYDAAQFLLDFDTLEKDDIDPSEAGLAVKEGPGGSAYKPTIIGSISIPKLKLLRPIANDVSRGDLRVAVGKIPGSSQIGQAGNISLAGHRNYAYKVFFDNLDRLEAGDLVILESNKGKFTYEIFERQIVEADNTSVLTINKQEHLVTLITCHPKWKNDKRLIYKGRLIDPLPKEEEAEAPAEGENPENPEDVEAAPSPEEREDTENQPLPQNPGEIQGEGLV